MADAITPNGRPLDSFVRAPRTRDLTCVYHLIDSHDVETTRQELMRNATAIVRRGGSAALNFRDLGHSVGVKSSTVHYSTEWIGTVT